LGYAKRKHDLRYLVVCLGKLWIGIVTLRHGVEGNTVDIAIFGMNMMIHSRYLIICLGKPWIGIGTMTIVLGVNCTHHYIWNEYVMDWALSICKHREFVV